MVIVKSCTCIIVLTNISQVQLRNKTSIPIFYYREKTREQMFYFDSNTTITLQCAALVFLESVC